jgi:kynurenine formamidase
LKARVRLDNRDVEVDLSRPIDIALELNFDANQPRHFGAPAATTEPFAVPGFSGAVATGASCNCNVITLIPHCNGTHTECVGHLTTERVDAHRVVPKGLVPALLITVDPTDATQESTDPKPQPGDKLVTRAALERNWPSWLTPAPTSSGNDAAGVPGRRAYEPRAAVIRTTDASYLTREAAEFLVSRGIEHLVVNLPSIDRAHDEGRLTAHRVFFGLQPRATAAATRPQATITEFAHIPPEVSDGLYLLEIQTPAIAGDAVPSRPLLYPI